MFSVTSGSCGRPFLRMLAAIKSEYWNEKRLAIRGIVTDQGYSIGRWEGDTLVIDTTHFVEGTFGNGFGLPSSLQKHLREELTLADDGRSITYRFTLTDPVFLSAPMSLESS